MAQRENLLTIDARTDDETGIYAIGEIDFGVSGSLQIYLERYGAKGMRDILVTLGHLAWAVKEKYYFIQEELGEADKGVRNGIYQPIRAKE